MNMCMFAMLTLAVTATGLGQSKKASIPEGLFRQIQADNRSCMQYYAGGKNEFVDI